MTTKRLRVLAIALCVLLLGVGILGSLFMHWERRAEGAVFSSEEILPVSSSWKEGSWAAVIYQRISVRGSGRSKAFIQSSV